MVDKCWYVQVAKWYFRWPIYLSGIIIVYHIGHIEGLFIPLFSKPSGSLQAQVLETGETVDAGEFAKFYDLGTHWTLGLWVKTLVPGWYTNIAGKW